MLKTLSASSYIRTSDIYIFTPTHRQSTKGWRRAAHKEQLSLCHPTAVRGPSSVALSRFSSGEGHPKTWSPPYHSVCSTTQSLRSEVCFLDLRKMNFLAKSECRKSRICYTRVSDSLSPAGQQQEPHGETRTGLITGTHTQAASYFLLKRNRIL